MTAGLARPLVCLVTDRRRLGRASDRDAQQALVDLIRAAAQAGVDLVQLRERDLPARDLTALAARCLAALEGTQSRLLINDRLDVALAVGAHGVHLRGDSVEAPRIRALAPPPFLVGRSVHSPEEARRVAAAGGVDYLMLGPAFPTVSKPGAVPLARDEVARAARAVTVPVILIGGITAATAPDARAAGAAGVAAIGLFADAARALEPARAVTEVVAALRRAFDTPGSVV